MYTKKIIVKNKTGIHARPASNLASLAKKFNSDIRLITDKKTVDAKSIISILTAGLSKDEIFTLCVEGPDERIAGEEISEYFNKLIE